MRSLPALVFAVAFLALATPVWAQTKGICAGKKGGISHCEGGKYVCKDGSKSRTKKICEKASG